MLDKFVHENGKAAQVLEENYLIMKVNYGKENRNVEFLKKFPKVRAYPHYFVLDSDGKFLHAQGTGDLEEGKGYNEKIFLAFLNKWRPQLTSAKSDKLDAEVVLTTALRKARAEKKKVLIHLGAPT